MTLSLESFLSTHQLDHYYTSFLEAGATDHDLSHLVQLNDQELSEFLLAMDMLPFHAIKLKKALREFRASYRSPPQSTAHVDDSSVLVPLIDETENDKRSTIVSHATIYGKKSSRPLTSYEVAINQASIQLALADSSLLVHKGKLFDLAKKKLLEEGYQYKRGKSRSKLTIAGGDSISANSPALWPNDTSSSTPPPPSSPPQSPPSSTMKRIKRKEHAIKQSHQRQLHIEHLEKQLDHVRQSIINETSTAATTMDHPPQSSSESLQTIKTDLVKKIGKLKAQERKHQWYKRKTHLQHQQQQQQQQCQQQMLPSLEALEPCVDNSRPLLLPLPSPPQKSHAFFSSSSSSSSLPSPPGCYHPMTVSSPPQSEVRAKVLTVRDCCNS